MREERIFLEYGVYLTLIRRDVVDLNSVKKHLSDIRGLKSADNTQSGGLTASRRTEKGDKFLVVDVKIDTVKNGFAVKRFGNISQINDLVFLSRRRGRLFAFNSF